MSEPVFATGITTDGNGRLFVADSSNNCIHLFSVNGEYLGCALTADDYNFGELKKHVRWHNKTSSLVVAHRTNESTFISIVKIIHP